MALFRSGAAALLLCGAIVASMTTQQLRAEEPQMERIEAIESIIAQLIVEPDEQARTDLAKLIKRAVIRTYEERGDEPALVALYDVAPGELKTGDELDALLAEINRRIPFEIDRSYLRGLYGFSSAEELALTWASPLPAPKNGLSKNEFVAVMDAFEKIGGSLSSERLIWFLQESLGSEFNIDLIYYPYAEWTNAELADEVERRRGLIEAGGAEALEEYERGVANTILEDPASKPWALQWAVYRLHPDDPERASSILAEKVRDVRAPAEGEPD